MIAKDLNVLFSGTDSESTSLTGWTRNTEFDEKYIVGCSSSDTVGGGTGGQTTHDHPITSSHLHVLSTTSSPENGNDTSGLTQIATAGHGHANANLSTVTPTVGTATNAPPFYKLIVIKSLGTSLNLPAKGVIIGDVAQYDPSPFGTNFTPANGAGGIPDLIDSNKWFPLGADTSGDSGDTGGSGTHDHDFTHFHTTPVTSGGSITLNYASVRGTGIIGAHTHSVTITNNASYNSSVEDGNPPNIIAVPWYILSDTPLENGVIGIWTKDKGAIPDHWTEVEGYRDYFVRFNGGNVSTYVDEETQITYYSYEDIGQTGGSDQHTHTSSHNHIGTTASVTGNQYLSTSSTKVSAYTHTHNWTISNVDANFGNNTSKTNYPPYIKVFFIKYNKPAAVNTKLYDSTIYNAVVY